MGWTKVRIVNCKKASIRRTPWIPLRNKDIVGIRDGPNQNNKQVEIIDQGEQIEIDPDTVCYDWTDKKFYKVRSPEGWIYEGVIDYSGGDINA